MSNSRDHRHEQFLRAFTTHEPAVRAFVRRLLPSRADVDDVLQEVSIVLWEKFDEFHEGGDFRAWACGIARFKVLAWMRDAGRDRVVLNSDVLDLIADESLTSDTHLERRREALETCLEKVPASQRKLLMLAYDGDARIQDVAATSGRSVGAFYQWLHRMRLLLMDCIRQELALGSSA